MGRYLKVTRNNSSTSSIDANHSRDGNLAHGVRRIKYEQEAEARSKTELCDGALWQKRKGSQCLVHGVCIDLTKYTAAGKERVGWNLSFGMYVRYHHRYRVSNLRSFMIIR